MNNSHYKIGQCVLDCQTQSLSRNGEVYKLSAKVFELLRLFLNSAEYVVSREEAIKQIWLGNEGVGQRGFTNAIWTLRKAFKELGEDKGDVFITLPKVGYQLNLVVAPISNSAKRVKLSPTYIVIALVMLIAVMAALFFINFSSLDTATVSSTQIGHEHKSITTYEGIEEHPAVSHNGQYVAFQWHRSSNNSGLYIQDLKAEDTPLHQISSGRYVEASPAWSESDESLAYIRLTKSGTCQVRVRHLVTNSDILIDEGCYYIPYRRVLDWSSESELIYSKKLASGAALFRYNFASKDIKQYTFPHGDEIDFAPKYNPKNAAIAFIREKSSQKFDVLFQNNGELTENILQDKVTIIDIDWDVKNDDIYVNYAENSKFLIKKISLKDQKETVLSNRGLPSNISLNIENGYLLYANHISKEYIAQVELESGKIKRRISSSSRDMYGRLSVQDNKILFLSNRSGNWALWLNNGIRSTNLTKGLGNATVPALALDGKKFAVSLRSEQSKKSQLYVGDLDMKKLQVIDTKELEPDNLSWSRDGKIIYFYVGHKKASGMYQIELATGAIKQLSNTGEHYLVEGENNQLYVSRLNVNGIWQLDPETKEVTIVSDKLSAADYGAFYWQKEGLYYLNRTDSEDEIVHLSIDGQEEVLVSFAANSIRKFFGISPGKEQTTLVTLKLSNESDIYKVSVF